MMPRISIQRGIQGVLLDKLTDDEYAVIKTHLVIGAFRIKADYNYKMRE